MENNFTIHSIMSGVYQTTTKTYRGKKHIVIPVVMMVEGVHSGSHGPILHTKEELSKFVKAWNGRPVTINHPEIDGQTLSASDTPELMESCTVGTIFHARMEDGKLKAEAWLDEEKLASTSSAALAYIKQNRPLDVSVGVFSDNDNTAGEWNGETYESIARNYRPDHLALLPDGQGACSWNDGCGVRVNKKGGNDLDLIQTLKDLNQQGYVVSLINNKQGYLELLNLLRSKVDSMDNDMTVHFLMEVYEDSIVYEKRRREQGGQTTLYKQSYQLIDQNTKVEFTGDPVEVRRNVEYVTMQMRRTKPPKENSINNNEKGGTAMADEKKTPCCLAKVEQLIANKLTHFTAEDTEWLLAQNESTIDKLFPIEVKPADPIQVNKEKALEVLREELKTDEEYLGILPDNLKARVQDGLKLQEAERSQLVKTIMDNTKKDTWTEEKLKGMDTEVLKSIANSIPTVADYSLMGDGVVTHTGGVAPMLPTGVEIKQ